MMLLRLFTPVMADKRHTDEHRREQEEHVSLDDTEEDLKQVQPRRNDNR